MIKFTILLVRKPALTQEEFVALHKKFHADLFMLAAVVKKTVRRYGRRTRWQPNCLNCRFQNTTSDPEYFAKIRPDEERFLDLNACDFITSTEKVGSGECLVL